MDANPFADLIPSQQGSNPFADLIPNANALEPDRTSNLGGSILSGAVNTLANVLMPGAGSVATSMISRDKMNQAGHEALVGLGSGFMKAGEGIKGAYLQAKEGLGYAPDGTYANYQKGVDAEHAFYDKTPIGQSTTGKGFGYAGQVLPYMIPAGDAIGAIGAGMKGAQISKAILPTLIPNLAKNFATGAGISALQYVPEKGSRAENTLVGGTVNTALPIVGKAVVKGVNALYGNFISPAIKEVIDLGKKWGVRVFASDAAPTATNKAIAQGLEELPVGMRGQRQAQMQEAQSAAQTATNQAMDQMLNTNFGGATGLKKLQQVANGSGIRAKAANNLLDQINNAGDDWQKIMQSSGNLKLFRSKLIADQKYNKVSQLADSLGPVDTSNIIKSTNNMIANESQGVMKNEGLLNTLNKVKQGLHEEQPLQAGSQLVDANGNQFVANQTAKVVPKQFNYSQLRQFRSDLGDEISDYFTGKNALIGQKGVGALQSLKNQVDYSLNRFANENGPQIKTAWKNADRFYQNAVVPYKDKQLAQSLTNADPDAIYSKFVTRGSIEGGQGTGRAQRFYQALDDKGKAAVRYGMINNAFQNSVDEHAKMFSPATFASHIENIASSKGVFFKGNNGDEVNGLVKLMRSVQRAPVAVSKPETGVKAIPWIAGAAVAGHAVSLPTALTVGGTGLGLRWLMTNPVGRNYLLAASKLKLNSPAMQSLTDKLGTAITRGISTSLVNAGNNSLQNQGGQ